MSCKSDSQSVKLSCLRGFRQNYPVRRMSYCLHFKFALTWNLRLMIGSSFSEQNCKTCSAHSGFVSAFNFAVCLKPSAAFCINPSTVVSEPFWVCGGISKSSSGILTVQCSDLTTWVAFNLEYFFTKDHFVKLYVKISTKFHLFRSDNKVFRFSFSDLAPKSKLRRFWTNLKRWQFIFIKT